MWRVFLDVFAALKLLFEFWVSFPAGQQLKRRTRRPPPAQSSSIWPAGDETQTSNITFNERKVDRYKQNIPLKPGDDLRRVSTSVTEQKLPRKNDFSTSSTARRNRMTLTADVRVTSSRLNNFLWFKLKFYEFHCQRLQVCSVPGDLHISLINNLQSNSLEKVEHFTVYIHVNICLMYYYYGVLDQR